MNYFRIIYHQILLLCSIFVCTISYGIYSRCFWKSKVKVFVAFVVYIPKIVPTSPFLVRKCWPGPTNNIYYSENDILNVVHDTTLFSKI